MTVAIIGAVAIAWLIFIWLVRLESGRVHRTPLGPLLARIRRMQIELGDVLLRAIRRTTAALAQWAEQGRCRSRHLGLRCEREVDHPGFHAHGSEISVGGATYWGDANV